jgi:cytochrome c-type biogenesis protein CcmF
LQGGVLFAPISREGGLLLNNLLLTTAAATVFLGTLYPLFLDAVTGEKVSVGPPFFDATFGPLMIPVLVAMAIGPMLPWKRGDLLAAMDRLKFAGVAAFLGALAAAALTQSGPWLAIPGIALGVWVIAAAFAELYDRIKPLRPGRFGRALGLPRAAWGMTLAHAGMGVTLLGIVASTAWQTESLQAMRPGQSVALSGYRFTFEGTHSIDGPNYTGVEGRFRVDVDGRELATLSPQTRSYPHPPMETTEAAIRPRLSGDLYAVIGDPTGGGAWSTRLYHKPLVHWIWGGAMIMVLGGALSLSDRRLRVGAPRRPRAAALAPAGAD